jgi:uncharacterized membrane protein
LSQPTSDQRRGQVKNFGTGTALSFTNVEIEKRKTEKGKLMSLLNILLVFLVLAFLGVIPAWGYSSSWGYAPGGTLIALIVLVLLFSSRGRLRA